MKLILAQGNPGEEYRTTRHNIGFMALDSYASLNGTQWQEKPKFHAYIAEFNRDGDKVLLIKPTTFYNETGRSARALIDFYKLDPASDLLVIHDDLALPFGTVRSRNKGSDAGNNGIKSINAAVGENYHRIRVGTWNELRNQMNDVDFVLGHFSADEKQALSSLVIPHISEQVDKFISGTFELTSTNL